MFELKKLHFYDVNGLKKKFQDFPLNRQEKFDLSVCKRINKCKT